MFLNTKQFFLLKNQFRTIGYNFNPKPKYVLKKITEAEDLENLILSENPQIDSPYCREFSNKVCHFMIASSNSVNHHFVEHSVVSDTFSNKFNLAQYQLKPGVYYFLNAHGDVIYVGKAKNIRKRLQSHFGNNSKSSTINYSEVTNIEVEYSGNDIIAQLIETENIKTLKPKFNFQQIKDPDPYLINIEKTANGILKLKISRKEITDNLPERFFNRESVKLWLSKFCNDFDLCRKHCSLERVVGPCSKHTIENKDCVCSSTETIENYNSRVDAAITHYKNQYTRKIYKLKGRNSDEDAFVYLENEIYCGYGFIDKEINVFNKNDILSNLVVQKNNYDTSRIVSGLVKIVFDHNVIKLNH